MVLTIPLIRKILIFLSTIRGRYLDVGLTFFQTLWTSDGRNVMCLLGIDYYLVFLFSFNQDQMSARPPSHFKEQGQLFIMRSVSETFPAIAVRESQMVNV